MSDTIYPSQEEDDLKTLANLQNYREEDPEYWVEAMSRRIIDLNFRITKLENIINSRIYNRLSQFESRWLKNQDTMFEWLKKELNQRTKSTV